MFGVNNNHRVDSGLYRTDSSSSNQPNLPRELGLINVAGFFNGIARVGGDNEEAVYYTPSMGAAQTPLNSCVSDKNEDVRDTYRGSLRTISLSNANGWNPAAQPKKSALKKSNDVAHSIILKENHLDPVFDEIIPAPRAPKKTKASEEAFQERVAQHNTSQDKTDIQVTQPSRNDEGEEQSLPMEDDNFIFNGSSALQTEIVINGDDNKSTSVYLADHGDYLTVEVGERRLTVHVLRDDYVVLLKENERTGFVPFSREWVRQIEDIVKDYGKLLFFPRLNE